MYLQETLDELCVFVLTQQIGDFFNEISKKF